MGHINVGKGDLCYATIGDDDGELVFRLLVDTPQAKDIARENIGGMSDNDLFNLREIMGFVLTEVENTMEDRKLLGRYTQRNRNA